MRSSTTSYFNPRAPCGARRSDCVIYQRFANISIHAPLAGRDQELIHRAVCLYISIHAPLAGRDTVRPLLTIHTQYFNPRAPCGARPSVPAKSFLPFVISIHAPLAGRDVSPPVPRMPSFGISIHAPLAGRDRCWFSGGKFLSDFNPRAPCGARLRPLPPASGSANFNPRAPCGARRLLRRSTRHGSVISIHAPLAGRDSALLFHACRASVFQSTRPLRGATASSFRSPRPGSNFNPRAPCGARPHTPASRSVSCRFQSTRPLRGATETARTAAPVAHDFNPRAPCGARRAGDRRLHGRAVISIHAPLAGRDLDHGHALLRDVISIHAPLAGRDGGWCYINPKYSDFNPRAPCGARRTSS